MNHLPKLEALETMRQEHLIYCEKALNFCTPRRRLDVLALEALEGLPCGAEVWIQTTAGLHLKLPMEQGKRFIQEDQKRISEELKIANSTEQRISEFLQEQDLTPEDLIQDLQMQQSIKQDQFKHS